MAGEYKFTLWSSYEMCYFPPVLTQIVMCRHILVNIPNMKFHETPSGGSRLDTGRADTQTDIEQQMVTCGTWTHLKIVVVYTLEEFLFFFCVHPQCLSWPLCVCVCACACVRACVCVHTFQNPVTVRYAENSYPIDVEQTPSKEIKQLNLNPHFMLFAIRFQKKCISFLPLSL